MTRAEISAELPSAEILLFPPRAPSPEERLRRALAQLDAALDEQREAVAEFQSQMGALGEAVGSLETSLRHYACQLTTTQSDVLAAQEGARQLEATAEAWMQRLRR